MITIERHPNLDNWIEIRYWGKLLDQFSSRIEAYRFAQQQAQLKRTKIVDLDRGTK
jgi:hypothetical protein|tara:strand:+ start:224 stop:391 length:168 start_codon:yes stop_codon:yes gene_type:complete